MSSCSARRRERRPSLGDSRAGSRSSPRRSRSRSRFHRALESSPRGASRRRERRNGTAGATVPDRRAIGPGQWPPCTGYELIRELGRGGMGVVYKARQLGLNRQRRPEDGPGRGTRVDPEHAARFRREAEAVARLQHPNIVQIYEIGEHDGRPLLLAGARRGRRAWPRDWPQGPDVGPARRPSSWRRWPGRSHVRAPARDHPPRPQAGQRPARRPTGVPKIADFGLAKRLDGDRRLTRTGTILGTPSYMAPSRPTGTAPSEVGPAGRRLRAGGDPLRDAHRPARRSGRRRRWRRCSRCSTRSRSRPARLQPKVPRDLETICLKCLEKEPAPALRLGRWSWPRTSTGS